MSCQTKGRMCNVCLVFYLCAQHAQWKLSAHKSLCPCTLFLHCFVFKVSPLLFPFPFPISLFAIVLPPFASAKLEQKQSLCGYFKLQSCHQMSACYIFHNSGIFSIFQFGFFTINCCTIFLFFPTLTKCHQYRNNNNYKIVTVTNRSVQE